MVFSPDRGARPGFHDITVDRRSSPLAWHHMRSGTARNDRVTTHCFNVTRPSDVREYGRPMAAGTSRPAKQIPVFIGGNERSYALAHHLR